MNLDVNKLVNSALSDQDKDRNVRIVSDNMHGSNFRDGNFLSKDFPRSPPKLYITAENDDFDQDIIVDWRNEGFDVEYFSMESEGNDYIGKLCSLSKENTGPCEKFGIIAFDDAAAACLQHYHIMDNNPEFKLGLLVAYYPSSIPDPKGQFPSSIRVLVHLAAGAEIGVVKQSQMVGIQGKKRTKRTKVQRGIGTGGKLQLAYPSYSYDAEVGFAEGDVDEFDGVSADLAWGRSLGAARDVFGLSPDLELVLEKNLQAKFFNEDPAKALEPYSTVKAPHLTNTPTLVGGIGTDELKKFYNDYFKNPPSTKITLLSRTAGTDRVVDEMHIRFKHTEEMPWILPHVPPTNKRVELIMVSIVAIRGGKIYHEHVYWDQASVLVQVGLLDPQLLPQSAKDLGVKKLPVVGKEAARKVFGGHHEGNEGEAEIGGSTKK